MKKPILRPACCDRAEILIFTRQIIFVIGRFVCILNLRDCVSLFPHAVLRLRQDGDIYREHGVNYPTAIFDRSVTLRYRTRGPIVAMVMSRNVPIMAMACRGTAYCVHVRSKPRSVSLDDKTPYGTQNLDQLKMCDH